jgi:lipoate-protein ligase B
VYTVGRNGSGADVLLDREALAARGVEVAECDRGGRVTYHGPGQLVGYPVINLSPDRRDVRRYVRDLQATIVDTLAGYGIAGEARDGQDFVGVWVGPAKIASIGVHLSRWVTTHGFALNVTTDLTFFAGIVPCGLGGVEITSIERLTGRRPPLEEVAARYAEVFAERFGREPVAAAPPARPAAERPVLVG